MPGSALLFAENLPFMVEKKRKRGRETEDHQGGLKPLEWVDEGARTLGRRVVRDRHGMRRKDEKGLGTSEGSKSQSRRGG